jgi:hypothetical protein
MVRDHPQPAVFLMPLILVAIIIFLLGLFSYVETAKDLMTTTTTTQASELKPRTVGLGMNVGWQRQTAAVSSSTTTSKGVKTEFTSFRSASNVLASATAPSSTDMLGNFSHLRNRLAAKEELDDDDFEEMADTISGILSGKYNPAASTSSAAASAVSKHSGAADAAIVKPPRKDKSPRHKDDKVSFGSSLHLLLGPLQGVAF